MSYASVARDALPLAPRRTEHGALSPRVPHSPACYLRRRRRAVAPACSPAARRPRRAPPCGSRGRAGTPSSGTCSGAAPPAAPPPDQRARRRRSQLIPPRRRTATASARAGRRVTESQSTVTSVWPGPSLRAAWRAPTQLTALLLPTKKPSLRSSHWACAAVSSSAARPQARAADRRRLRAGDRRSARPLTMATACASVTRTASSTRARPKLAVSRLSPTPSVIVSCAPRREDGLTCGGGGGGDDDDDDQVGSRPPCVRAYVGVAQAPALGLLLGVEHAAGDLVVQAAALRVRQHHLHPGVALLEVAAHARQRAPRACASPSSQPASPAQPPPASASARGR
eukprot:scaffold493_cov300-Prasinococcus_capsulatus_cf.AAC.1